MKKIITILLVLFSTSIFSQSTQSRKFQRKFKKLNTEQLDKFLLSNNFEKTNNITHTKIWGITVEVSTYYNEIENENFSLIICKDFPESFHFVGGYLNDSLVNFNYINTDVKFEYTNYTNIKEYSSFLVKQEE